MDTESKEQRQAVKALRDALSKYDRLSAKAERMRAKLEKRQHKLQALEARIEDLTRRIYEPYTRDTEQAIGHADVRRARLIFKPDAAGKDGGTKQLKEIVKRLRAHDIIAEVDLMLSDEMVQEMVKEAVENEDELVIVAGGDDSVERVAEQLVGTQTALGIIPVGAQNHHAEALGVPLELEAACALIGTGVTTRIAAGQLIGGAQGHLLIVDGRAGAAVSDSV